MLSTKKMFQFLFIVLVIIGRLKAQTGGTSDNGDIWSCVPPGYCDNNIVTSPPGVDPRIITPEPCPTGYIQCFTQGPSSRCGQRFVTQAHTTSGPADNGAYPWQAYITNGTDTYYAGSGVLIDNYHVLTAAHKVALSAPANVIVSMGVYDHRDRRNAQNRTAVDIQVHPGFNSTLYYYNQSDYKNDIAIITVYPPFALSAPNINTACLPVRGDATLFLDYYCVVAGWGETAFTRKDQPVAPMKQVYVTIVDYATCRTSFARANQLSTSVDYYLDPNGEICAGGEPMLDACTYDGGAPLTCPFGDRQYIAGMVIWGKGCGQPGVYGVYVGVPSYRAWIDETLAVLNAE